MTKQKLEQTLRVIELLANSQSECGARAAYKHMRCALGMCNQLIAEMKCIECREAMMLDYHTNNQATANVKSFEQIRSHIMRGLNYARQTIKVYESERSKHWH